MRAWTLLACLTTACAPSHVSPVSSTPIDDRALFQLTLDGNPGIAAGGGHAVLTVRARAISGQLLAGVAVRLHSERGLVQPAEVLTDSDGVGVALLSGAPGSVRVMADAADRHVETLVALQPIAPVVDPIHDVPPASAPEPFFVMLSAWSTSVGINSYNECMGWPKDCVTFPLAVPVRFHAYLIPASTAVRAVHFDFGDGQSSDVTVGEAFHQYAYDSGGGLRTIGIRVTAADGRVAVSQVQITLSPTP